MAVYPLTKEEKLELQNSALKVENFNLVIERERIYQEKLTDEILKRLNINRNEIKEINIITGIIETTEVNNDKPKKNKISIEG